ncbi:Cyclic nucleotide-binding:Bacterial regulatory protein, Crp [Cupriavidus taiwanensis]|uniref:Cyclic nucleotide-binding:Bacterial regulatory protein, Crp n=1 Tax=Cupriavidus taiwanensis TaxID=164546 RepID=A0A976B0K7_9BURK|nr:Crp/Fnr family transcriptional regulator [Cupriavidus taiwanensis]SOZ64413.1 Cyclic nucleotide-binding:Bacterial regulatory protein, Crp [Cupriavidus taiwanensis]SOZ65122.1 Cyclic nucleotide-binding:Bacterial regulatory protein, Crp [Cupriavidus taiwanensis]SOZ68796.1 Cyclic nucleotide-binding:Bacterial regulatory protein, Crp [Cupriavidus taiwanensis]SPA08222.1 Cyclic nucleotide-binding:Bacterial regulatory protein, Crp [Cupriavidus taiwanensis]
MVATEPACHRCMLHPVCGASSHPDGLEAKVILPVQRALGTGEGLYRQGQVARMVFAVRAGAAKLVYEAASGWEQLIDYALGGEVLALGLGHERALYQESAVALQPTVVCAVPAEDWQKAQAHASVRDAGQAALRRADMRRRNLLVALGQLSSPQRLAMLLLDLQAESISRARTPPIVLPFSRADIASYLGLTVETVSRLLHRFASAGLIRVNHRLVHIIDPAGLEQLLSDDQVLPDVRLAPPGG